MVAIGITCLSIVAVTASHDVGAGRRRFRARSGRRPWVSLVFLSCWDIVCLTKKQAVSQQELYLACECATFREQLEIIATSSVVEAYYTSFLYYVNSVLKYYSFRLLSCGCFARNNAMRSWVVAIHATRDLVQSCDERLSKTRGKSGGIIASIPSCLPCS